MKLEYREKDVWWETVNRYYRIRYARGYYDHSTCFSAKAFIEFGFENKIEIDSGRAKNIFEARKALCMKISEILMPEAKND